MKEYVHAEFEVFKLFFKHIMGLAMENAKGNSFAQLLTDGGTLKNKKKYQALAVQFVDPEWKRNHVICFGFPNSKSNTDTAVAELVSKELREKIRAYCGHFCCRDV